MNRGRVSRHVVVAMAVAAAATAPAVGCADAPSSDGSTSVVVPPAALPDVVPDDLAATGLYVDVARKVLSPRARPFAPAVALWSDGADKQRWVDLPDGAVIDTTNPDEWRFPIGTKAWKEFRAAGKRIETRFFWKVRDDRWIFASYVWSDDETSAMRGEGTTVTRAGTPYHVPTTSECNDCHRGRKDRLLGFEAVSLGLDGAKDLTLATLVAEGRLSVPPSTTSLVIADDGTGKAAPALAWLHVSCGVGCHNGNPNATGYPIGLRLRLGVAAMAGATSSAGWEPMTSTIGVAANNGDEEGQRRIVAGDPDHSLVVQRIAAEGPLRMPPVGPAALDAAGLALVRAWVTALPPAVPSTPEPDAGEPPPPPPAE